LDPGSIQLGRHSEKGQNAIIGSMHPYSGLEPEDAANQIKEIRGIWSTLSGGRAAGNKSRGSDPPR